jgi:NADPH:quinone reductase-like Zn-dependent oxidoreductase
MIVGAQEIPHHQTFFTALQALHLVGNLQPGETVLIHAGASGVGQSLIQLARLGGASKILTTAGSYTKCALCRSLGADVAVNYREQDFAPIVERETAAHGGVNLVVDLVGHDYWHRNTAVCAMEARIVIVAALSGSVVDGFDIRALLNKRLAILATTLRTRPAEYQEELRDLFVQRAMPGFRDGTLKVTVDEVLPWSRVGEGHKKIEANENAGKIICVVD